MLNSFLEKLVDSIKDERWAKVYSSSGQLDVLACILSLKDSEIKEVLESNRLSAFDLIGLEKRKESVLEDKLMDNVKRGLLKAKDMTSPQEYFLTLKGIYYLVSLTRDDFTSIFDSMDSKIFKEKVKSLNRQEILLITFLLAYGANDAESALNLKDRNNDDLIRMTKAIQEIDELLTNEKVMFSEKNNSSLNKACKWGSGKLKKGFKGVIDSKDVIKHSPVWGSDSRETYFLILERKENVRFLFESLLFKEIIDPLENYQARLLYETVLRKSQSILRLNLYDKLGEIKPMVFDELERI